MLELTQPYEDITDLMINDGMINSTDVLKHLTNKGNGVQGLVQIAGTWGMTLSQPAHVHLSTSVVGKPACCHVGWGVGSVVGDGQDVGWVPQGTGILSSWRLFSKNNPALRWALTIDLVLGVGVRRFENAGPLLHQFGCGARRRPVPCCSRRIPGGIDGLHRLRSHSTQVLFGGVASMRTFDWNSLVNERMFSTCTLGKMWWSVREQRGGVSLVRVWSFRVEWRVGWAPHATATVSNRGPRKHAMPWDRLSAGSGYLVSSWIPCSPVIGPGQFRRVHVILGVRPSFLHEAVLGHTAGRPVSRLAHSLGTTDSVLRGTAWRNLKVVWRSLERSLVGGTPPSDTLGSPVSSGNVMSRAKSSLTSSSQVVQPLLNSPTAVGMDAFVVNVLPVCLVRAPVNVLMTGGVVRCLAPVWNHTRTTGVDISYTRVRILSQRTRPPPDKNWVHVIHPVCLTHASHVGNIRGDHHSPHTVVTHTHCHLAFRKWFWRRWWRYSDLLSIAMVWGCAGPSTDLLCWICCLGHARRLTVYSGVAYWRWLRNVPCISTIAAVATVVGILGIGLETE